MLCLQNVTFANEMPPIQPQILLKQLEGTFNGKIGVYAIDTNNNQIIAYRADERFPVQSTVKLMGVAALLQQSQIHPELLNEKIHYTKNDLNFWRPITEKNLKEGMTLSALSEAAISYSDNPAINLIMKKLGGPNIVTDFAHSIGNKTFNLVHFEGELNSNPALSDDTATPKDMAISVEKLTLGNILAKPLRAQLLTWMTNTTTSYKRMRYGVPIGWVVADKTGSGDYGVANDIGLIWPPTCKPIVIAIYTARTKKDAKIREDIVAKTTEVVLNAFAKNDACINAWV